METKAHRTSTILVAVDGRTRLYGSRSEMSPRLRERMKAALNSPDAATIVIADKRGRNEILKMLRGEPSILKTAGPVSVQNGVSSVLGRPPQKALRSLPVWLRPLWVRAVIAFLLPAAIGAGFYALLTSAR